MTARTTSTGGAAPPRPRALSLKARALAWLAQREHSIDEMRRKLLRHLRAEGRASGAGGAQDADEASATEDAAARVEPVIAWLCAQGHLSEARFVESRVHVRAARYGNRRIRQELARHGVALDAEAARALDDSEAARVEAVWRRKFGVAPADPKAHARQARFLAQRGFSPESIARLMRRVSERHVPEQPEDT